jgi:hypothetical protein
MTAPIELPMAIAGCGLDQTALEEQLGRYGRLGAQAQVARPSPLVLSVDFMREPDSELLRTTIAVERECCSFFALEYAHEDRRLTVSVDEPERRQALDAIETALRGRGGAQEEATEPSRPHTGQDS